MLSKMIRGVFNFFYFSIKNIFYSFINLPQNFKAKLHEFANYIYDFKYRFTHLGESNYELGIYHLQHHNLNDAIMRFKLVDRFFKPGDSDSNYWLGVTYYLKNDIKKALHHLSKLTTLQNITKDSDARNLISFLQNIKATTTIPFSIWNKYRDLMIVKLEAANPIYTPINIIHFIKVIMNNITNLPNNYKILELGSNIGLLGEEIKKRFPDKMKLSGLESARAMYQMLTNNEGKFYDEIIFSPEYKFLNEKKEKFDIVISCCSISFSKDLIEIARDIEEILAPNGYFAICFRAAAITAFSIEKKEFCYNEFDICQLLEQNNFNILHQEKLLIEKTDQYFIIISQKKDR